jgi:dipeptidyl aminopeptidase/acylaminoacyl peptidase
LYRCAAAGAAPVNLVSFLRSIPPYWGPMLTFLKQRIGDPDTDTAFLLAHSPVSRAADIRIPVLLAYGENDPRVKLTEAEQIVESLRANGVEHELLILPDEGHDLAHHENRMLLLQRTEALLARHLGGRCEP